MRVYLFLFWALIIFTACKKGKKGESEPVAPPAALSPEAALLSFPEQNGLCINGTGGSATQNSVTFKWLAAKNSERYELSLKNLSTGLVTSGLATGTELVMTINRATPYSWFVISKSKDGLTAQSNTWKFYNAGNAIVSYPPFPADELSPALAAFVTPVDSKINLSWKGADADADLLNYDLYFGIESTPPLHTREIITQKLDGIAVIPKTRYYWRIVSRDQQGNTSSSDVVQFSTN